MNKENIALRKKKGKKKKKRKENLFDTHDSATSAGRVNVDSCVSSHHHQVCPVAGSMYASHLRRGGGGGGIFLCWL